MNIGVLNSGGDCPGLNAVIEGVVGAASRRGWNVVGFYDGFEGLLSEEGDDRFEWLTPAGCRGLRAKGGTILGTVNKGNLSSPANASALRVFPVPGGPISSRLCPPLAAISRARLPCC